MISQIPMVKVMCTLEETVNARPLMGGLAFSNLKRDLRESLEAIAGAEFENYDDWNKVFHTVQVPYQFDTVVENTSYLVSRDIKVINMDKRIFRKNFIDGLQAISAIGRLASTEEVIALRFFTICIEYLMGQFYEHDPYSDSFHYSMEDANLMLYHARLPFQFYREPDNIIFLRRVRWW